MKRVLFVYEFMHIGGTENFILNAIKNLPADEYKVDLFLTLQEGPYMEKLPENVRLVCPFKMGREALENKYKCIKNDKSTKYNLKKKRFFKAIGSYFYNRTHNALAKYTELLNDLDNSIEYDIVVCSSLTEPFTMAVASKINAVRRYAWVHMPFKKKASAYFVPFDIRAYRKYLDRYNGLVCVSKGIEQMVRNSLPNFGGFISTLYNFIDVQAVKVAAQLEPDVDLSAFKDKYLIVSVGRAVSQKGFDIAIESAAILKKKYDNFVWLIIGDGKCRTDLQKQIIKLGLNEQVILLGAKDNPFPYVAMCDVYCQTSRFESYCIAVLEARILGKPVVATNFIGSAEQLNDGENGLIVDISPKQIADALYRLTDSNIRLDMSEKTEYPNALEKSVGVLSEGYLERLENY